jgi:hypothetical protein
MASITKSDAFVFYLYKVSEFHVSVPIQRSFDIDVNDFIIASLSYVRILLSLFSQIYASPERVVSAF